VSQGGEALPHDAKNDGWNRTPGGAASQVSSRKDPRLAALFLDFHERRESKAAEEHLRPDVRGERHVDPDARPRRSPRSSQCL